MGCIPLPQLQRVREKAESSASVVIMQLTVIGWEDANERELIEEYVRFCLDILLPITSRVASLIIEVVADHSLIDEGRWGEAVVLGFCGSVPSHFRLRLRKSGVSLHNQLKVSGHECVHIGQFHLCAFEHFGGSSYRWGTNVIDTEDYDDWMEPWEVEARGKEKGLLELFIRDQLGFDGKTRPVWYMDGP